MISGTVEQTDNTPAAAYSDFSCGLSWQLNEVAARAKAAHLLMVSAETYDESDQNSLGVVYLLSGIAERMEELALRLADSELTYALRGRS